MSAAPAPYDVFSSLSGRVPFDVAAYARMRKFAVETQWLKRAIENIHIRKAELEQAEGRMQEAEELLQDALLNMRKKIERDPS